MICCWLPLSTSDLERFDVACHSSIVIHDDEVISIVVSGCCNWFYEVALQFQFVVASHSCVVIHDDENI
jgi:hypothetical protein